MTYTAAEVARGFLAFANEHGDLITNLKLQRLLYYAQGWHLALHGRPLFDDALEAWITGPVCPAVFWHFKPFAHRPIDLEVDIATVPPDLLAHVTDVWESHGSLSAYDLERASRREVPWLEARAGLRPDEPCDAPLRVETMKAFFAAELASERAEATVC